MWHRHLACGAGAVFCEGASRHVSPKMKSPLEAPEKQIAEETSAKPPAPASVIDTSKMSKGKREALELAEASRDPLDDRGSFASNLFIGRYDFARIHPYPEQSAEDRAAGKEFLAEAGTHISVKMSIPTKSIAPAKSRRR